MHLGSVDYNRMRQCLWKDDGGVWGRREGEPEWEQCGMTQRGHQAWRCTSPHLHSRSQMWVWCFGFPLEPQRLGEAGKPVRRPLCADTSWQPACFDLPNLLGTSPGLALPQYMTVISLLHSHGTGDQKQPLSNVFRVLELSLEQLQWRFMPLEGTVCNTETNLC